MKKAKKLISALLAAAMLFSLSITVFAMNDPDTWEEELTYIEVDIENESDSISLGTSISDDWYDYSEYYAVSRDTVITIANKTPEGGNDYINIYVTLYPKLDAADTSKLSDGTGKWTAGQEYEHAKWELTPDGDFHFMQTIMLAGKELTIIDSDDVLAVKPGESFSFSLEKLSELFSEYWGETLEDDDYFFVISFQHQYPDSGRYWGSSIGLLQFDEARVADQNAMETAEAETGFTDISASAYYYDAVKWAKENNITTGTSATTFGPDSACTRGQVVTFLWRAMGCPEPTTTENPFADVSESNYYYKAVLWAVEQGITTGTSATAFSPNTKCSNAHILTFLWRAMGQPGEAVEGKWYASAENWAKTSGLLADTAAESSITGNCPRCYVVTFLYRELAK